MRGGLKMNKLFKNYHEEKQLSFHSFFKGNFLFWNTAYMFSLKNGRKLDLQDYPELNKLGYWIKVNDQTNLRLWSRLGLPRLTEKFCQITGLQPDDFYVNSVSGLNSIWPTKQ